MQVIGQQHDGVDRKRSPYTYDSQRVAECAAGNPVGWYKDVLEHTVLPHAKMFATLQAYGEVAVGVGLVLGLLTGLTALVVTTVGLSNTVAAGWSPAAPAAPGTINTIVVVDADVEPAALVNLALTVTEVKTLVLLAAGLSGVSGRPVSGTSTDAVVVAATGRGPAVRFGGPISDAGWVVASAARAALADGVGRWMRQR